MENNKYIYVCGTIIFCVFLVCGTVLVLNDNPYTININADDNFREALQGLDFTTINTEDTIIDSDESNVTILINNGDGSSAPFVNIKEMEKNLIKK